MDIIILAIMEMRVCCRSVPSVAILKQNLVETWDSIKDKEVCAGNPSTFKRF